VEEGEEESFLIAIKTFNVIQNPVGGCGVGLLEKASFFKKSLDQKQALRKSLDQKQALRKVSFLRKSLDQKQAF
jgi:hypothetical protein